MGQKCAIYSFIIIFLRFGFNSNKQTDKLFTTISALKLKKQQKPATVSL